MTDKTKPEALSDADLDGVVGACPVPYPDLGGDGPTEGSTKSVGSNLGASTSSEGGVTKDVVSSGAGGKGSFSSGSMDVKSEGKGSVRLTDIGTT